MKGDVRVSQERKGETSGGGTVWGNMSRGKMCYIRHVRVTRDPENPG